MGYYDCYPPEYDEDPPCSVCGLEAGVCICPECPECGSQGDPACYVGHGLVRTQAQIKSLRKAEQEWSETAQAVNNNESINWEWE